MQDNLTFDKFQSKLLQDRYLLAGEMPIDMFKRVADTLEMPNSLNYMKTGMFMPNSPTLYNAGTESGQLSACFCLPIHDNMYSIYETLLHTAIIHKSGGGTGFNFSNLRPAGDKVGNSGGQASGVVSFMRVYDAGTEAVKQGGKRRGANMGMLDVEHPDIFDFLTCKQDDKSIQNFNLSTSITDDFMTAQQKDQSFDLLNPRTGDVWETIDAREVWDQMIENTWGRGDPGYYFRDAVERANPHPDIGDLNRCNPCGETPLRENESCNLGSINLAKHLEGDEFDWGMLEDTVRMATEFLNQVIAKNKYPLPQIEKATTETNKIGLGVMGWADALMLMDMHYDGGEAIGLAHKVMEFVDTIGKEQSNGRNATVTTIAPTGSISILAGCSSGIEPNFGKVEEREQNGEKYTRKHPLLGVVDESLFRLAHEVSADYHIMHQAAFQRFTDNAISKTINLPNDATRSDIEDAINMAHKYGCKGTTIYRDESKSKQVITKECTKCQG